MFFFAKKKELGIHDFIELDLAIRIQANFTFFQMVLFPFRIILRAIVEGRRRSRGDRFLALKDHNRLF